MKKDYEYKSYAKIHTSNYSPFLRKGCYKIIDWCDDEPIIIGNDGHKLRLDKKEHYSIINKLK